jgi:hypothetical protein
VLTRRHSGRGVYRRVMRGSAEKQPAAAGAASRKARDAA